MKRIWIGVLVLAMLLGACGLAEQSGKFMARTFTYYDEEGTAHSSDELLGKPAVINFMASWCPPCKMELPYFDAAYQKYSDEIEFLIVDLCGMGGDDPADAKALVEEAGYAFPLVYDKDAEAVLQYGISSIPVTLLIAPDGEILASQVGSIASEEMLLSAMEYLIEDSKSSAE